MTRTPVGTLRQPLSDTALFAHIAYRLEDVRVGDLSSWAKQLGVLVGEKAIRDAPRTAERLKTPHGSSPAIRPWALVDFASLNMFAAIVTLRVAGARRQTSRALEQTLGVIEVLVPSHSNELLVVVAYERRHDKTALEAKLGEFAEVVGWQELDERLPDAAISTFRGLALAAAGREGLLRGRAPGET